MSTSHVKSISLRSYHKRAAVFKALGLNSRGREYKRRPNLTPEGRAEHYRRVNREKWHRLCQRRADQGLTSRGGQRIYKITFPVDDLALLECEADLLGQQLARVFESLPPAAQARVIEMGHAMGSLKKRLQKILRHEEFQRS
jgi:hypothetical protein